MNISIHNLTTQRWPVPVVAAGVGFVIGAIGGHIYETRKKEESEVIVINVAELRRELDDSINSLKDKIFPDEDIDKSGEDAEPGPLDRAITIGLDANGEEVMEEYMTPEELTEELVPDDEPEIVSIFAHSAEGEWNWETELKARKNAQGPFPIHQDEYMTQEEDAYSQSTLTYYEADDIMADSNDTPLYGWKTIIGPLRWGFGSSDINSFYVRNPAMKADYEILRDRGSFAETVLGLQAEADGERAELKHSRSLRFRLDD